MKISTKGRYSLRMLLDLAMHSDEGFISLKDIAQRQQISKKYLEQIVPLLSRSGLLRANRGYQGGYMLSKPADQYTVAEILRLTEGNLAPVACLEGEENLCPRASECITLPVCTTSDKEKGNGNENDTLLWRFQHLRLSSRRSRQIWQRNQVDGFAVRNAQGQGI